MSIRAYLAGDPVHDRVIRAFAEGCGAELATLNDYQPSDIAIIFGVRKSKVPISWPRGEVFRRQREQNRDVIVLETGYINRGDGETHHYAAGFNGLNGRADFRNKGMPPDRASVLMSKHGATLKPWRTGKNIVLCGQVPWDASVDHTDHIQWLHETAEDLRRLTKREIIFRPHPKGKIGPIPGCTYSMVPLTHDLLDAHTVVTFNSNSGVEATIEGVPAVVADEGSMVWEIASRSLQEVEDPKMTDREQWLCDLAYAQWTLDEMRSGETWNHLSP